MNWADPAPLGIRTLPGNVIFVLGLDRNTKSPPGPARPESETVPVEGLTPKTVDGLRVTSARIGMITDMFTVT